MEFSTEPKINQLFVTLLDGKTLTLNSPIPQISGSELKRLISSATKIPTLHQRLSTGTREISDDSVVAVPNEWSIRVSLRLRGGKGGFGSLLRGAGSKAWQKKTSNFDACRDMSGRRLRHVNAERRLEEWRASEEERRLEKKAEEFLKKAAKKGKNKAGNGEAEKYVAKYREESERCVSEVLDSVKAAAGKGVKRKALGNASGAKRLKIWMGKQTLAESDSDDSDEEQENEKSTISEDNGNRSDFSKDGEGSSGSVTGMKQNGDLSGGGSSESGSEEEKEKLVLKGKDTEGLLSDKSIPEEHSDVPEPASHNEKVSEDLDEHAVENVLSAVIGHGGESTIQSSESHSLGSDQIVNEETGSSGKVAEIEIPLNFDDIRSASELEVLGLERLKSELQDRGLKCGGTVQERAARLFLLKSTPLDKLPKKLFAKK